jgi:hypothetical protein
MCDLFFGASVPDPGNPSVVYVDQASQASVPDGDSWGTAYASLSESLQSDLTGMEEIWVAEGICTPPRMQPACELHPGFRHRPARWVQRT